MTEPKKSNYTPPYTKEFKARSVRMVRRLQVETGQRNGAIPRVAQQLGCNPETLRLWVRQAEIDAGEAPGATTADSARIKALEQENKEPARANEILRRASVFFAAELDRPQR